MMSILSFVLTLSLFLLAFSGLKQALKPLSRRLSRSTPRHARIRPGRLFSLHTPCPR